MLGGLPATGQGAKLRITFAGDGSVTQLSNSLRKLEQSGSVPIIGQAAAAAGCAALYGPDVRQLPPTLGYQLPALTAADASGKGTVKEILPAYTCNPVGGEGAQAHRLLPAVPGAAPHAKVVATKTGDTVVAYATVDGGTAPYTYEWSSSTTALAAAARDGSSVKYSAEAAAREERRDRLARGHRRERHDRDRVRRCCRSTARRRASRCPAAAASASSPSARPTSASSRPSTSGSARRTARSASRA